MIPLNFNYKGSLKNLLLGSLLKFKKDYPYALKDHFKTHSNS